MWEGKGLGLSSGLGLDTELGDDDVGMAGRESVTEAIKVEETEASVCVFCSSVFWIP